MTDCFLQRFMRMHNVPLPRVNIDDDNPYKANPPYTQKQLDMRRKVEILKYSANKSSSQTNALTKKERFALAMRGALQTKLQNQDLAAPNCPNDDYVPTPTSSCGVPGPVMYLTNDPNVPLYNYSVTNTRTYPDYVPNNDTQWRVATDVDASFNSLTQQILCTLLIYREIANPVTVYNLTVPVGLDVRGTCLAGNKPAQFTVSIQYVKITVLFNQNLVTEIRHPPTGTGTGLEMQFDVSANTAGGPFIARKFVGNMGFVGLPLSTVYNFVYQFNFTFSVSSLRSDTEDYNPAEYWVGSNVATTVIANMIPLSDVVEGCHASSSSGSQVAHVPLSFVESAST